MTAGYKLNLAIVLTVGLLVTSCVITRVNQQVEVARESTVITGRIDSDTPANGPIIVVAYYLDEGEVRIAHYVRIHSLGSYELITPIGEYLLFAFVDSNNNLTYDDNEIAGRYGRPDLVKTGGGGVISGIDIEISEEVSGFASFFSGIKISDDRTDSSHSTQAGAIANLDDEIFGSDFGQKGYWAPVDFFKEVGGNIYFLEPYDPDRIPVLFVHGALGSPQDWRYFFDNLDRERYQAWFYYYPSGAALTSMGNLLSKKISDLELMYKFKQLYLVAHSMGGLVSRGMLINHGANHPYIKLFITLSTPWGGVESAETGVEIAPFTISAWRDVTPASKYINRIFAQKLPPQIDYFLFFGHKGDRYPWGKNNDGSVSIESQLYYRAQAESAGTFGFNEDHMSILFTEDVFRQFSAVLAEADRRLKNAPATLIDLSLDYQNKQNKTVAPSGLYALLTQKGKENIDTFFTIDPKEPTQKIGPVVPGNYDLKIVSPTFKSDPENIELEIKEGETPSVAFSLSPTGVVSGWVSSEEAPGVSIGIFISSENTVNLSKVTLSGSGVTRALTPKNIGQVSALGLFAEKKDFLHKGMFGFFDLPDGDYRLLIEADGFVPYEEMRKVRAGAPSFLNAIKIKPVKGE